MKLLRPSISTDLQAVDDLPALVLRDETLLGIFAQNSDLGGLKLKSVVINDARISKCNFMGTRVEKLQLQDCIIERGDMTASVFASSSWHAIEVTNTRASGIQLQTSLMKNVVFKNCKLDLAYLRFARLENVVFESCIINELDLYAAQLKNVEFVDCMIEAVGFSESKLHRVDLSRSTIVSVKGLRGLKGASISPEQLVQLAPYLAQEIGLIVKD